MTAPLVLVLALMRPALAVAQDCDPLACPQKYMPSPHPASGDKKEIADQIVKAQRLTIEASSVRTEIKKFDKKYREKADLPFTYEDYLAKQRKLAQLDHDRYDAYNGAIQSTIRLYGLQPPQTDLRQAVNSPVFWTAKPWNPRYGECEIENAPCRMRTQDELDKEIADSTFDANGVRIKGFPHTSATRQHGEIVVLNNMFSDPAAPNDPDRTRDPDDIAIVILHETSHWIDKCAVSGSHFADLPENAFLTEARAYSAQADFAEALGNKSVEVQVDRAKVAQYREQARISAEKHLTWEQVRIEYPRWLPAGRGWGSSLPEDPRDSTPPSPEAQRVAGDAAFLKGLDGLSGLAQEAQAVNRRAIADDDERHRREFAASEARLARAREEREARTLAAYRYIKTAAGLACSDPDGYARICGEHRILDADIDADSLSSLLSEDVNRVGWHSLGEHADDCQEDLIRRIASARNLVPAAALGPWAREYRDSHPGLLKRLTTSLDEFASAISDWTRARGESPSETRDARRGRENERPERPEPGEPPQRHSPDNWGSLNSLRGLAGSH